MFREFDYTKELRELKLRQTENFFTKNLNSANWSIIHAKIMPREKVRSRKKIKFIEIKLLSCKAPSKAWEFSKQSFKQLLEL